jgi:formate dehydrogenase subunit beta
MNINRVLLIQEDDPVNTLRNFLAAWWLEAELDAMIAPVELPDHAGVSPQVIENPNGLADVNPFIPVMSCNAAPIVEDYILAHPSTHLAVIMRPCELRALVELEKRHTGTQHPHPEADPRKNLVVIGMDCPGTFSLKEYQQQLVNQSTAELIREVLAYASQDSYVPRQVRTACHMCDWPTTLNADFTIGTIGVAPQGIMLVIAHDEDTDERLGLQEMTDGMATEQQEIYREELIGRLARKRARLREKLMTPSTGQIGDINSFLGFFACCTLCADCLDACPLYDGELTGMLGIGEPRQGPHPLLSELVGVGRWLASCSGCGMCQEACEHGVALGQIITTVSHRIRSDLHYTAGDPHQPLPWGN